MINNNNIKLNFYCIKCSKFANKNDIKNKTNLHSHCKSCGFKKFEPINKEDLKDLLRNLDFV